MAINEEEFKKRRIKGLWILWINLALALISYFYFFNLWSGIYLLISIFLLANRIIKRNPPKEGNYIFGDKLGNSLGKVTPKFQLEATMMSLLFLILGLTATSIYIIGWSNFELFFKIMTGINGFFGVVLLFAQLAGYFQSYQSLMAINEVLKHDIRDTILKTMKGGLKNAKEI